MKKEYLLTPGPTQIPPETLLEMARPAFHHRTPRYKKLFAEVSKGLQEVFRTKNGVITIASSGTGAMEAAVTNTLSPGDQAICVRGGKFGERWSEICAAFGIKPIDIDMEWGTAVTPDQVKTALKDNPAAGAVFITLCETSTGVATDVEAIGKVVKDTDAILVVDGISGVGAMVMETDKWNVDILVVGSQKALMLPPGLAFLAISHKASHKIDKSSSGNYYFDLKKALKKLQDSDTPYTPAVPLVAALKKSLDMILAEGIENVWKRHAQLAAATRAAATTLGLELFAKSPADAVTAIRLPEGVDGVKLVKKMRDEMGVSIAGGQADLKGKICRIAHMGYMNQFDILVAIGALELAMKDAGCDIELGAGLRACQEVFAS